MVKLHIQNMGYFWPDGVLDNLTSCETKLTFYGFFFETTFYGNLATCHWLKKTQIPLVALSINFNLFHVIADHILLVLANRHQKDQFAHPLTWTQI